MKRGKAASALYIRAFPGVPLQLCRGRQPLPGSEHTQTGDVRSHSFYSQILEATLDVWVYVPPGYSPDDPWRYPTLYLHDGQNVFDESTSAFGVEWGVDEAAETLICAGDMEPILIVAIANTADRMAHFTPFPDPVLAGGEGRRYRAFLKEELKPWIDGLYSTRSDPAHTAIAGSSLGGLSALYLGWTCSDTFGLVAALSPSLWWGERKLITMIGGQAPANKPFKIWIDMGTAESLEDDNENGVPDAIDDLRTLRAVLLAHGYVPGETLFCQEIVGGGHHEAAWSARIASVLKALFPPRPENQSRPG